LLGCGVAYISRPFLTRVLSPSACAFFPRTHDARAAAVALLSLPSLSLSLSLSLSTISLSTISLSLSLSCANGMRYVALLVLLPPPLPAHPRWCDPRQSGQGPAKAAGHAALGPPCGSPSASPRRQPGPKATRSPTRWPLTEPGHHNQSAGPAHPWRTAVLPCCPPLLPSPIAFSSHA
jgi:hypothetical protein